MRKDRPRPFELPEAFDPRADASRIALLAMAHREPRHLVTGEPIDLAAVLEAEEKDVFAKILGQRGLSASSSPANRLVHPRGFEVHKLLRQRIAEHGPAHPLLESHLIDRRSAELLAAGDLVGFLARRGEVLTGDARLFCERMAAWDHNDRPSLDHLLAELVAEP